MLPNPARRARVPLFFGLTALIALASCTTDLGYLWKQGKYLAGYDFAAKDTSALLRDPRSSPDLRAFLSEVNGIRSFAVKEIGLKGNGNFSKYERIDRDYLVSVVQASAPLAFLPYQWDYPIVGKLPYKGYYEPSDARAEAKRLSEKGYDVVVRQVDAFSSLGILKDPIYSFMESYTRYELASVIIHEDTHATLFLKGQDDFNEALATLVGDQGALDYLGAAFGEESSVYSEAKTEMEDSELYLEFVTSLSQELAKVYQTTSAPSEKLEQKKAVIARYESLFRTVYQPRFGSPRYRAAVLPPLNNAYLMLTALYNNLVPLLREYEIKKCEGSLPLLLKRLQSMAPGPGTMEDKIKKELSSP